MKPNLNRRDKYHVTVGDDKMTLCKACRIKGINYATVYHSMIGDITPQEAFDFHLARMQERDNLNREDDDMPDGNNTK